MEFIIENEQDHLGKCDFKYFYKPILDALNSKNPAIKKIASKLLLKVLKYKKIKKFYKLCEKYKPAVGKKLRNILD